MTDSNSKNTKQYISDPTYTTLDGVDIFEDRILDKSPELFDLLLFDYTTKRNIVWATDDYVARGDAYKADQLITPELITGENSDVIQPRVVKSREEARERSRNKAEVFTPSWVCAIQNNLCDNNWFGRDDVFVTMSNDNHSWTATEGKIEFPDGKTWQDYVLSNRMEITCGEAPYMVSRYDTTTGNMIPFGERVGFIDRKLRVVCENCDDKGEWFEWTKHAFESSYGYEWQGDNLLLARENLLYTFQDAVKEKWKRDATVDELVEIATIICRNVWQMDGLTGTIPIGLSLEDVNCVNSDSSNKQQKKSKAEERDDVKRAMFEEDLFNGFFIETEKKILSDFQEQELKNTINDGMLEQGELYQPECIMYDWKECKEFTYNSMLKS